MFRAAEILFRVELLKEAGYLPADARYPLGVVILLALAALGVLYIRHRQAADDIIKTILVVVMMFALLGFILAAIGVTWYQMAATVTDPPWKR